MPSVAHLRSARSDRMLRRSQRYFSRSFRIRVVASAVAQFGMQIRRQTHEFSQRHHQVSRSFRPRQQLESHDGEIVRHRNQHVHRRSVDGQTVRKVQQHEQRSRSRRSVSHFLLLGSGRRSRERHSKLLRQTPVQRRLQMLRTRSRSAVSSRQTSHPLQRRMLVSTVSVVALLATTRISRSHVSCQYLSNCIR